VLPSGLIPYSRTANHLFPKIPTNPAMRRPVFGAGSWHEETQRASLAAYEAFTSLRFLKDGLGRRVESNKLDKYIINGNEYLDYTGNPLPVRQSRPRNFISDTPLPLPQGKRERQDQNADHNPCMVHSYFNKTKLKLLIKASCIRGIFKFVW
jgi:hypothetical protein